MHLPLSHQRPETKDTGDSSHDFVSRSGLLGIEAQDWMLARAYNVKHVPLQIPFHVHWSVVNICDGAAEEIDRGDGTKQYSYVLAATYHE